MTVGEIFLSATLKVLLTQLASGKLQSFVREVGIGPKLEKWENMLKMVQAVIEDAEAQQLTKSAVKVWLAELQDLAYEMEDIVDEFATKALGRMLKAKQGRTGKALSKIPDIKLNFHMWSKMNSVTSRLTKLSARVTALGLREISGEPSAAAYTRPPRTSLAPAKAHVYGRDKDKARILEMVLGNAQGGTNFCVISVVGLGGIGKTTLAREVYNDKSVVKHFGVRAWVSIHDDFDVLRISKTILSSVSPSSSDIRDKDLNQVQVQLKQELAGKIFLLVLDDVWSKSYDLWQSLTSPFTTTALGSKIIVTTRHKEVALVAGSHQHVHELEVLSDDNCWFVFVTHAFDDGDIIAHQNLKQIREKVVKKCRGLPLAAETLGGLLHSKQSDEWEDILDSNLWDLLDKDCDILPVLRLSYFHLSSPLKSCFAYCAILLKGYEFEEEELVLLWMAIGFIQPEPNKEPEALGHKYFRDLLSMSLFQQSSINGSKFIMHDLVNDLAQWISRETTLTLDNELGPYTQSRSFNKALHLSYTPNYHDTSNRFEGFQDAKCLRTLLATVLYTYPHYLDDAVLHSLLPKLKKLRVLSLTAYQITQLPNSIAGLRHIRYLNFSNTAIRNLPESISTLYNLQILMLRHCKHLKMLPSKIGNLVSLRYLNIKGVNLIRDMPSGMNKLECLRTLSNFIVSKSNESNLMDLKNLKFIAGELHISSLENAYNSNEENGYNFDLDIREAILVDKQYLEVLILEWGYQFDISHNETAEKYVLDRLKPHGNLKELAIKGYAGRNFPSWVGDPRSLFNLTVLRLERCAMCESLPTLGLLGSLKDLTIKRMRGLKHIGSEIYGEGCSIPFKSLKNLYFQDLQEWELWDTINKNQHIQIFPSLCELSIVNCPKLLAIPPDPLPSLENLEVRECTQLTISVYGFPSLRKLMVKNCLGLVISARSLPSLENLKICNCTQLTISVYSLPSLRELMVENCLGLVISARSLPMLNKLEISKCRRMDFNGPIDFTSLKSLILRDISLSENWFMFVSNISARLEHLEISNCDSLKFLFGDQLPLSLKRLVVKECKELRCLFSDRKDTDTSSALHNKNTSNTNTSLLEKLDVVECNSLRCLSSKGQLPVTLKHLSIIRCLALTILSSDPLPTALTHLSVVHCRELTTLSSDPLPTALTHLSVNGCWALTTLSSDPLPTALTHLSVNDCSALTTLSSDPLPTALTHLSVNGCSTLTTLSSDPLPTALTHLSVNGCSALTTLSSNPLPTALTHLSVNGCSALTTLSSDPLPTALTHLSVEHCRELTTLSCQLPLTLEHLNINNCSQLATIAQMFHTNSSIESISIRMCENLASLPDGLHKLSRLQSISIISCDSLVSFPEGGLPDTSLIDFSIVHCWELEALPNRMHSLNSLQQLRIKKCPGLISFPEEGFPTQLKELYIESPKIYKLLIQWGLHKLASLRVLEIRGCSDAESFPQEEMRMMLPTSLTGLTIANFPKLKKLSSKGFQNLSSLKGLKILNCPNLKSFPKAGLPSSLLQLSFSSCPLLRKRYVRADKEKWSKIAHIPLIVIDEHIIYN